MVDGLWLDRAQRTEPRIVLSKPDRSFSLVSTHASRASCRRVWHKRSSRSPLQVVRRGKTSEGYSRQTNLELPLDLSDSTWPGHRLLARPRINFYHATLTLDAMRVLELALLVIPRENTPNDNGNERNRGRTIQIWDIRRSWTDAAGVAVRSTNRTHRNNPHVAMHTPQVLQARTDQGMKTHTQTHEYQKQEMTGKTG
jgi:hypothetical protein